MPLATEAVELLAPIRRQGGFVFAPLTKLGLPMARDAQATKVVTEPGTDRTATAHDLRRAFGARWSKRVVPAVLKEIMRHADIETTMTFYVSHNARITSSELWAAAGNNLGNSDPKNEYTPQESNL